MGVGLKEAEILFILFILSKCRVVHRVLASWRLNPRVAAARFRYLGLLLLNPADLSRLSLCIPVSGVSCLC
jgi:hypothetical protein